MFVLQRFKYSSFRNAWKNMALLKLAALTLYQNKRTTWPHDICRVGALLLHESQTLLFSGTVIFFAGSSVDRCIMQGLWKRQILRLKHCIPGPYTPYWMLHFFINWLLLNLNCTIMSFLKTHGRGFHFYNPKRFSYGDIRKKKVKCFYTLLGTRTSFD